MAAANGFCFPSVLGADPKELRTLFQRAGTGAHMVSRLYAIAELQQVHGQRLLLRPIRRISRGFGNASCIRKWFDSDTMHSVNHF
jgi:hypothetical protein